MAPCGGNCKKCCSLQSPPSFQSLDPSRHDEVLSLLRNNASSIGSISESSVISLAEKDLTDCSSQIRLYEWERNRIDGILMSLRNEKRCLERHWKDCQGLRAPIRRIPAEVLRNVFILLEGNSKMAGPKTDIEGLQVAAVSYHWRDVALSTKQLWTIITVDQGSSSNPAKQLQVLDRVLKLSGSRPLSLTINTSPDAGLVSRLFAESHRWIRGDFRRNHRLQIWRNPGTTSLPSLEHLAVHVVTVFALGVAQPHAHSTPRLHTLEINGISQDIWHQTRLAIPQQHIHFAQNALTWANVRQLILTEIPLDLTLDTISRCPNLMSATINECEFLSLAVPPPSFIYKSSLTTLSISGCPKGLLDDLFRQIDFPQLTSLKVVGNDNHSADDSSFPTVAFRSMLHRTNVKLQSLTLDNLAISSSDQLFELVPSLTSLTIDSTSGLISDSIFNRMNTNLEPPARVLLPNLDKLTLRFMTGFTVRAFVDMVRSRWLLVTSTRRVAGLRKVIFDVYFQLRDVDLRPLKALKAAGMDITISDSRGSISLDTGDEE
ncbi:hypothetical protein C8J56DRAFT_103740, partial [Mycena floridula]